MAPRIDNAAPVAHIVRAHFVHLGGYVVVVYRLFVIVTCWQGEMHTVTRSDSSKQSNTQTTI